MTSIEGHATIFINRKPKDVWSFMVSPKSWGALPLLRNAHLDFGRGGLRKGSNVQIEMEVRGVDNLINLKVVEFDRPHRIGWRGTVTYRMFGGIFRPSFRFEGLLEFKEMHGGTMVAIFHTLFPSDNPIDIPAFGLLEKRLKLENLLNDTLHIILVSFQLALEENQ